MTDSTATWRVALGLMVALCVLAGCGSLLAGGGGTATESPRKSPASAVTRAPTGTTTQSPTAAPTDDLSTAVPSVASSVTVGLDRVVHAAGGRIAADRTDDVSTYGVCVVATRSRADSVLIDGTAHDAAVVTGDGGTYLLVHPMRLARSDVAGVPTDASNWTVVGPDYFVEPNTLTSVDSLIEVRGRYLAYRDGTVYATTNVTDATAWTRRTTLPFSHDPGAYYDGERVHLFYEAGTRSDHSGPAIGHASSPDGVTDWTVHDPVFVAPDGHGTGDYSVIERDGVYLVFGDYTADHPNYSVAVWAGDDLYSNFTRLGTVLAPMNDTVATSRPAERGIQDVTVAYDRTRDRYVLYAHVHSTGERDRWLHAATATIDVRAGTDAEGCQSPASD